MAQAGAPDKTLVASYERPFVPFAFDVLIRGMFLPFGGVSRLRCQAVDLMQIEPGMRVLELGCGTGSITKLMVERGANVTAVDGAAAMLTRARIRAPNAQFMQANLEELQPTNTYQRVLFAFVLHELPSDLRQRALNTAVEALEHDGRLIVLDHAVPASGLLARGWRRFLLALEPASVADCIENGYADEFQQAGLEITETHQLAGGTAKVWVGAKERAVGTRR